MGDRSQIGQRNPPCPQCQDDDGDNRARHCRAPTTTEGIIDWVGARYHRALSELHLEVFNNRIRKFRTLQR